MITHDSDTGQETEDDDIDSRIPTRNSGSAGADVEGFNEDFSHMLRAHFRERFKMKKAVSQQGHVVTFSFVISLATPLSADRLMELEAKAAKKKSQGGIQGPVDSSMAIAHIHMEYSVLPNDTSLKTDIVFYPNAAKIFPDRHDAKTVRTWWADGQLWCSWTHSHAVYITEALLRRLTNHTVEIRLWDSREKLSQRARIDRPKGFRISDTEGAHPGGIGTSMTSLLGLPGGVIVTQAKLYAQEQPRQILFMRPFAQTIRKHALSQQQKAENISHDDGKPGSPTPGDGRTTEKQGAKVIPQVGSQLRDYSQLARTANADDDFEDLARKKRLGVAYRHGAAANAAMMSQMSGSVDKVEAGSNSKLGGNVTSLAKRIKPSPASYSGLGVAPSEAYSRTDMANTENSRVLVGDLRSSLASVNTVSGTNLPVPSGIMQTLRLRMAPLYDGRKSTTTRIVQPAGQIADCMLTLIVDPSLLSEEQMDRFKPVLLFVVSAGPLPPGGVQNGGAFCRCLLPDLSPVPMIESPVNAVQNGSSDDALNKEKIAQKKMEANLVSQTEIMEPITNDSVYWNHAITLLTGDIPDEALRVSLLQCPLSVELHDRDPPGSGSNQQLQQLHPNNTGGIKPAVFGTLPNDSELANTAVVPPPPPELPKPPYGCCTFSLHDLLVSPTGKGVTFSAGSAIVRAVREASDGVSDSSLQKKISLPRYLEYGTVVKIKARAPIPLFTNKPFKATAASDGRLSSISTTKTPKSKSTASIVIRPSVSPVSDPAMLSEECISTLVISIPSSVIAGNTDRRIDLILSEMIRITAISTNSDTLGLSGLVEMDERAAALTAYQLAPIQQVDKTLNLVTGFQLVDDDGVLLVVEGFGQIIAPLWENASEEIRDFESSNRKTKGKIEIFYNSSLSSTARRYGGLELSYCTVTLGRAVSKIVAEPLLYVRDMAPSGCRIAVVKLAELRSSVKELSDIIRRDLLPTSAELRSLTEEFAVKSSSILPSAMQKESTLIAASKGYVTDSHDEVPLPDQYQMLSSNDDMVVPRYRDFLRENMEGVWTQSEKNRLHREKTETLSIAVNTDHIYSSHSVNAVEIAKAHIRDHMLRINRRYTFDQNYQHRTMTPRSASPEIFATYPHARRWQFPGHVEAIKANRNPRMPDTARREELSHPWRENWLHEKYLQPPLVERGPLPWDRRHTDMNTSIVRKIEKPLTSVFQAGDGTEIPLECLPPRRDRRLPVFRRGITSEIKYISDKFALIDHVSDILHDPPAKLSLKFKSVRDIPKTSILAGPASQNDKCLPFGPFAYNDWLFNKNVLPLK